MVVQFPYFNYDLTVNGTLTAVGTAADSIRFKGKWYDNNSTHGGEINFNSTTTNSVLDYVVIDSLGDTYFSANSSAVYINSPAKPTINHTRIAHTKASEDINTWLGGAEFITNTPNTILGIRGGTSSGNSTLPKPGANSYYKLLGTVEIASSDILTLQPGVVVQFPYFNYDLTVNGTLTAVGTAADSIRFKGKWYDNNSTHGGKINFASTTTNSVLDYVVIDSLGDTYFGANSSAVYLASSVGIISISNSSIRNSESVGIQKNGSTQLLVNKVNIIGNATGVKSSSGSPIFNDCNIFNNSSKGIENTSSIVADTVDARNCWWGSATGPAHSSNPGGTGNSVSDRVKFDPFRSNPAAPAASDIGVVAVLSPTSGCDVTPATSPVKIRIYNYGNTAQSGFSVSYRINSGAVVTENVGSLSVPALSTADYTFSQSANLTNSGTNFSVTAYTSLVTDSTRSNDTIRVVVLFASLSGPFGLLPPADSAGLTRPVAFSWQAVTNATRYQLYVWHDTATQPATPDISNITGTSYSYNSANLQYGQTYKWRVRAVWDNCFSESAVQKFRLKFVPDIIVSGVSSSATTVAPGDSVTVNWTVGNIGVALLPKKWNERIYIQSSSGENRTWIGGSDFTGPDSIATGQSITRSRKVKIPEQLYIGDQGVFVVEIVPGAGVQEEAGTTANNTAVQPTAWMVQKILSFSISASGITEGGSGITGYVYRSGSLAAALTVNISGKSGQLQYPVSANIPAEQTGASFSITAPENTSIEGDITDTLIANALGFSPDSAFVTVIDNDDATLSITHLPQQIMEGATVVFKIETNKNSAAPIQVFLSSGNQLRFPLPASVNIPANTNSVSVQVTVPQNNVPDIDATVSIRASAANHTAIDTSIFIKDDDLPAIALTLQTNTISEGAGLYATQASLRRISPDSSVTFTVNISASIPGLLLLPASLQLAAGEKEKTFTIGVHDNTTVDTLRPVTITAAVFIAGCGCNAPASSAGLVSAILNVSDNDGPALTLTAMPQTLPEGVANAGRLRIARNTATTNALTVNLSSGNTAEATVPATATIPVGVASIEAPITTIDDGLTDGNKTVYFTATATGFSQGVTWATVTDANLPDLTISSATLNRTSAQPGDIVGYTVAVKNAGTATAPAGLVVHGYFSRDSIIDNTDSLISEDRIGSSVQAGQIVQVLNAFAAPVVVGNYYLLFKINPSNAITEFQQNNNTGAPVALQIVPGYTATAAVSPLYVLKGTAVTITGTATLTGGGAAVGKPVEVYIITNGLRRSLSATTNASGTYSVQFVPLQNEAGHYTVGASYPGLNAADTQDAFDILGVKINNGETARFSVQQGDTLRGKLQLQNLSNTPLTNFTLSATSLPNGASLRFGTIASLASNGSDSVSYSVSGTAVTTGRAYDIAAFNATATQGVLQWTNFYYYCYSPLANIVASIEKIDVSVAQAGERLVEFKLTNRGAANSGTININLPEVNWLTTVTPKTLPNIGPGDSAIVTLKFRGTAEIPVGAPITGQIGIVAQNGNVFTLPFTFKKVATSNGAIKLNATDQYTYYMPNAPKVSGAQVVVKQYYTGAVVAQGITDSSGIFAATVPEGSYRVVVEKDKHLPYSNTLIVNPSDTTRAEAFLNYQAITYTWTVVPTAVQDQYTVTLTSKFETHVPVPVVKMIMEDTLPELVGSQQYQFMITLINYGLITAHDVELYLPEADDYEFITNYEPADLGALSSIQIPVLMRKRTDGSFRQPSQHSLHSYSDVASFLGIKEPENVQRVASGGGCLWAGLAYWYPCAGILKGAVSKAISIGSSGSGCGGYGGNPGGGAAGGSGGVTLPSSPIVNALTNCNLPLCVKDVISTILSAKDIPGLVECRKVWIALQAGIATSETIILPVIIGVVALKPAYKCYKGLNGLYNIYKLIERCTELVQALNDAGQNRVEQRPFGQDSSAIAVIANLLNDMIFVSNAHHTQENWSLEYFGNIIDSDAWEEIADGIRIYVYSRDTIPQNVQQSILNKIAEYNVPESDVNELFTRWNTSIEALRNNILEPNTQYPNIINWTKVAAFEDSVIIAQAKINSEGFDYGFEMYDDRYEKLMNFVNEQKQAVCASVTIQFSQQLTMTREAFAGTLGIFNGHPTDAMDSITVNLKITDENGIPANGRFEIQTSNLTGLTNVTGMGTIDAQQTGTVKFLFIPKINAAPTVPKVYRFGGSITYWDPFVDTMVTMPLNAVPITVNPSPNLALHYFLQRNILGDDALTSPQIEPSVPATLAVMVNNQGYGPAVNLAISSAQPKVVENEKGLAIDFQLTGSSFNGQPKQLGITDINFGTIPALETRIGEWYFTSSLLGKFVSYEANVVHNNSLGNPELSLINSVRLHELTHSIKEYGALADGLNDYLVNDLFDINDQPDIIYFSQGSRTAPVRVATSGSFSAPVTAPQFTNTLSITASQVGWNYIKLPDPGNGLYSIESVTRSDGQIIPLPNAWLTSVTLPAGHSPIYENKFHFVDSFRITTPVTYIIVWKPNNTDVPKVDSINGAPAQVIATALRGVTVVFNKAINPSTFTYADLTLTLQGSPVTLGSSVVITQIDSARFDIDLGAGTTGDGTYVLNVQTSGVADVYGINGNVGKQVIWTQYQYVPAVQAFQGIPANRFDTAYTTMQVLFNLPIDETTVTPQRFIIMKNGVVQSGSVVIDSVRSDRKLFYLSGLQNILTTSGEYVFTVDVPQIKTLTSIAGLQQQSITLTLDNAGPTVINFVKSDSGALDAQHVPYIKISLNEDVIPFNITAVKLTRNGIALPLSITQLLNIDFKTWIAGNFDLLTYPEGNYVFTIYLDSLKDKAGNKGTGSQQISWTVDRSTPVNITNLSIAPDKGFSATDGITSGLSFTVGFTLSAAATNLKISQYDLSGEVILYQTPSATAGAKSIPIALLSGGNTGIKVSATGTNGVSFFVQKQIFADQLPLTAQWKLNNDSTIERQPDTITLKFSEKLLNATGFLSGVELKLNGSTIPTSSNLDFTAINDTVYNISGFRSASRAAGNYELGLDVQNFSKYSSGNSGSGKATVNYTVKFPNRPPVANAGNDTVLLASGNILLNGSLSSDPDLDSLSYVWTPPTGITLNDSSKIKPTATIPAAANGSTYSFLLVVKDGALFSTDVVNVSLSYPLCPGSNTYFAQPSPGEGYNYQWQVDSTGTGFVNLSNNAIYTGATADTLQLTVLPSSYYGYKYRRIATKSNFVIYGSIYTIRFASVWTGNVNTDWNNPANWSCISVPDEFTDAIIPRDRARYPVVSASTSVRSVSAYTGTSITINNGVQLDIKGKRGNGF